MDNYTQLLADYIQSPDDAEKNWQLGLYYNSIGQTASAVSFYLRAAERTEDALLKYECLLKSALCFNSQGTRNFTVKGLMQHAIAILPHRPEAYFLLSRHYEREAYDGHWNDCFTISSIGEWIQNNVNDIKPLRTDVEYPKGNWGLTFEKAVSSWWCGLCEESKDIFTQLYLTEPLDDLHYTTVHNNLNFLKSPLAQYQPFEIYRFYEYDRLKLKFDNADSIYRNYSEAFQDIFILTLLNGKHNGSYLEIGAGHPIYGNNTYLLEKDFNWSGISVDYDQNLVDTFTSTRKNACINSNATLLNFDNLISEFKDGQNPIYWQTMNIDGNEIKVIDYLQIDCDPPEISYQVLLNMDFTKMRFRVITFEHDYYADSTKMVQLLANEYLTATGYTLIAENISPDGVRNYEDWWVDEKLIDPIALQQFKELVSAYGDAKSIKHAKKLFLND